MQKLHSQLSWFPQAALSSQSSKGAPILSFPSMLTSLRFFDGLFLTNHRLLFNEFQYHLSNDDSQICTISTGISPEYYIYQSDYFTDAKPSVQLTHPKQNTILSFLTPNLLFFVCLISQNITTSCFNFVKCKIFVQLKNLGKNLEKSF